MERVQKVIAQAGVTSRRKAEKLIVEGRVKVNGEVITELGVKVSPKDRVEVDDVPIEKEAPVYYVLNKPTGVLSTVEDDRGRKTVIDLMPHVPERIFPVGRLDYDTSGVLLLTNDGDFSYKLTHPKYEVKKVYVARVEGNPERYKLRKLERGIELEDGKTAPAKVRKIRFNKKSGDAIIEITIHEGRNRQVRRMFDAIGHPVVKLTREQFGIIHVHGLNAGESRALSPHEGKQLRVLAETGNLN